MPGTKLVSLSQSTDRFGNTSTSSTYQSRKDRTVVQQSTSGTGAKSTSVTQKGLLISQQSPQIEQPTTVQYDALRRKIGTSHPVLGKSSITYNPKTGRVASTTAPGEKPTTYTYNPKTGRAIKTTGPKGTQEIAYNLRGQKTATWGSTYPIQYRYGEYGAQNEIRTYKSIAANAKITKELLEKAEPQITKWKFDEATGLLLQKLYPDGKGPKYTYLNTNQLDKRTRADGGETKYQYHPKTRALVSTTYSDKSTPGVIYKHDKAGTLISVTDAAGTRKFIQNNSGQLAKEIFTPKGTDLQFTIDRTYTTKVAGKNGIPSGVTLTNKANQTIAQVAYAHDALHRLQKLTSHQGEWIYRHDPKTGRLAGVQGPKHWALYQHDHQRGLLKAISNQTLDGNSISTHHYQHDDAGNRIKITQSGLAYPKPQEKGYQYDNLHQVVAETRPDGKSTWDFDAIGNRLNHTSELGSQKSETTYKTNQLNQYTTVNSNSFELAKPQAKNQANKKEFTPTYNPNGSLLKDNKNTCQWNGENRLIKTTTKAGKTIESIYDFQGRRTRQTIKDKQGKLEDDRIYLYGGWNVMAEVNTATGKTPNTYTWGNDLSGTSQGAGGVGGLLAAETETATFYPLFDGNGNVTQYLDEEGELAATFEYGAFGHIAKESIDHKEITKIDYRFSTKPVEAETGWYYYGYRYYDPDTGRWPSRDPIEERGAVNLYGIVGNNGINSIDTLGLFDPTNSTFQQTIRRKLKWVSNFHFIKMWEIQQAKGIDTIGAFTGSDRATPKYEETAGPKTLGGTGSCCAFYEKELVITGGPNPGLSTAPKYRPPVWSIYLPTNGFATWEGANNQLFEHANLAGIEGIWDHEIRRAEVAQNAESILHTHNFALSKCYIRRSTCSQALIDLAKFKRELKRWAANFFEAYYQTEQRGIDGDRYKQTGVDARSGLPTIGRLTYSYPVDGITHEKYETYQNNMPECK